MQESLSPNRPASQVAWPAVLLKLCFVTPHSFPAFNLPFVIRAAPSSEIPAIPLKPTSRIFFVDPAFLAPDRQRLRGINFEKVKIGIASLWRQLGVFKPVDGKFSGAISHVLTAEDAEAQHLFWCQVRMKIGMEVSAFRFRQKIDVSPLHQIIDDNTFLFK